MPTKQEMQQELKQLRKRLRENEELMHAAAVKAEDMMALKDQYDALKEELAELKRKHPNNYSIRFKD